jgi:DNA-binding response OmpR family regulator
MRTPGAFRVVESEHAVADLIAEVLRDDGYTVGVAHDRLATLASIAKQRPALIRLDEYVASLLARAYHPPASRRHFHHYH